MFLRKALQALRRGLAMATERPRAGLWTSLALVCALAAAAVAAIAATSGRAAASVKRIERSRTRRLRM